METRIILTLLLTMILATATDHAVGDPITSDVDLTEWAEGLYAEAGLDLPMGIAVHFSDEPDACGDANGVYNYFENSLVVCVPADRADQRRRVLVHELAHAWDDHNLSDDDRQRIRRSIGAETYFGHDVPWARRAVEHVAETITWGLLDPRPSPGVPHGTCTDLAAQFEAITGQQPLDSSEACQTHSNGQRVTAGPAPR